ncbi:hypothetical protein BJX76DRAFT_344677 [Aspergillus varians]
MYRAIRLLWNLWFCHFFGLCLFSCGKCRYYLLIKLKRFSIFSGGRPSPWGVLDKKSKLLKVL